MQRGNLHDYKVDPRNNHIDVAWTMSEYVATEPKPGDRVPDQTCGKSPSVLVLIVRAFRKSARQLSGGLWKPGAGDFGLYRK